MDRQKQIFEDGKEVVHFTSVFEMDRALCGQDLAGDSDPNSDHGSYGEGIKTKEKVDCEDCISIVTFCKKKKRSQWVG